MQIFTEASFGICFLQQYSTWWCVPQWHNYYLFGSRLYISLFKIIDCSSWCEKRASIHHAHIFLCTYTLSSQRWCIASYTYSINLHSNGEKMDPTNPLPCCAVNIFLHVTGFFFQYPIQWAPLLAFFLATQPPADSWIIVPVCSVLLSGVSYSNSLFPLGCFQFPIWIRKPVTFLTSCIHSSLNWHTHNHHHNTSHHTQGFYSCSLLSSCAGWREVLKGQRTISSGASWSHIPLFSSIEMGQIQIE